jgi:subtilisin family serine protease
VSGTALGGGPVGSALPGIGVAPDAELMAARACTDAGCAESDLLAAVEWMLDPGDPARRPDVLVGSWGLAPDDTSLDRVPAALVAAGVVPVFAAGNGGPGCGTVASPASVTDAIAVGAVDADAHVDQRSSRGPGRGGAPKPDLVAPGTRIVSAVPGGGYGEGEGTSMAAPHVAGAAALLLSAGIPADDVPGRLRADAVTLPSVPEGCGDRAGAGLVRALAATSSASQPTPRGDQP